MMSACVKWAKEQVDAGKLLDARARLNDALQTSKPGDSLVPPIEALMSEINQTLVFARQHVPDDPYGGTYVVQPGESLTKIATSATIASEGSYVIIYKRQPNDTWQIVLHVWTGTPPPEINH